MNYTEEQISRSFESLPENIQDMLFTPDVERKVQRIGVDAGLLIEQLKRLNSLTNFTIMGILNKETLGAEIKSLFELTDEHSKEITEKIFKEIVAPLDEIKLKALSEQRAQEEKKRVELENEERLVAQEKAYATTETFEVAEPKPTIPQEAGTSINVSAKKTDQQEAIPETTTLVTRMPAEFFPKTKNITAETNEITTPEPSLSAQALELAKIPSRMAQKKEIPIPRDLPTQETSASFLPNLAPKTATPERPLEKTAPFEDKLKRVFTSGTPTPEGTKIETTPAIKTPEREEPVVMTTPAQIFPEKSTVTPTTPHHADPYREPIE